MLSQATSNKATRPPCQGFATPRLGTPGLGGCPHFCNPFKTPTKNFTYPILAKEEPWMDKADRENSHRRPSPTCMISLVLNQNNMHEGSHHSKEGELSLASWAGAGDGGRLSWGGDALEAGPWKWSCSFTVAPGPPPDSLGREMEEGKWRRDDHVYSSQIL